MKDKRRKVGRKNHPYNKTKQFNFLTLPDPQEIRKERKRNNLRSKHKTLSLKATNWSICTNEENHHKNTLHFKMLLFLHTKQNKTK